MHGQDGADGAERDEAEAVVSPRGWSLRMAEMPTPSAMMNGTVMGPVVTPPESNATARNSGGTKNARRNTTA